MITLPQLNQSVTSFPLKPPKEPPKLCLKTQDNLYVLGVLAGTVVTAVSQQAALTSIPLLGLLLMQRANQQRLTLAQKQQQQQLTTVVERSLSSLSTQIQKTQSLPQNYLTKTHLAPIIAKLHQLQRETQHFKLKELGTLTQHLADCNHQLETLQTAQQNLEQQFQQLCLPTQPEQQPQPALNSPLGNNRVAIFIDEANLRLSALHLGLELLDYADLLTFLKGQSSSFQAFFYTGVDSSNQHRQKLLWRLQRLGYQIVSKEIIKRADGTRKANLDVELALDLVELANTYDTAILASGDGDFAPAIERIQRLGKRVEVVAYRATTSQKLLELADNYFNLETLIEK